MCVCVCVCVCVCDDVLVSQISLTLPPLRLYLPSLPKGPLDDILCPYRAVVDKFLFVVQCLVVRVKRLIGECRVREWPLPVSAFV